MARFEKIRYEAKIEALQYVLNYECKNSLPISLRLHMEQLIKEYKLLLDDLQSISDENKRPSGRNGNIQQTV